MSYTQKVEEETSVVLKNVDYNIWTCDSCNEVICKRPLYLWTDDRGNKVEVQKVDWLTLTLMSNEPEMDGGGRRNYTRYDFHNKACLQDYLNRLEGEPLESDNNYI